MHGKTVGVIGTGQIGTVVAQILTGFACPTLAFDPFPNAACRSLGVRYVELNELLAQSDVITLHCPLTPENKHLIGGVAIARMKTGVMLINTSRGALLDTVAIIEGLKSGKIGYLGLDVYEEEEEIFFEDRSGLILSDDVFARLLHVSQCDHHRPPGFLHAGSLIEDRRHNDREHHEVREQSAARKTGRLARFKLRTL